MRPGLDADDIYIMVEDELLATAQLFTQHLHHAEYVRLKKEARNRNAATLDHITRPVDQFTSMRKETRKQKEGEARAKKLKSGLDTALGEHSHNNNRSTDSDENDDDLNEGDEPWQGTHLQRFMTESPPKIGLTGLQGVTSNTRAAAGFERPERRKQNIYAQPSETTPIKLDSGYGRQAKSTHHVDEDLENRLSFDDDLDVPIPQSKPLPRPGSDPISKHSDFPPLASSNSTNIQPQPPPRRSFLDLSPLPKHPVKAKPLSKIETPFPTGEDSEVNHLIKHEHEPNSSPTSTFEEDPIRQRMKARREDKMKRERERAQSRTPDRGSGSATLADEIPLFLG